MDKNKRWTVAALAGCGLMLATDGVRAAAGPVVLRIYAQAPDGKDKSTGQASNPKADAPPIASYDMAFIKSLPQHSFVTRTPWFKAPVTFKGPLLRDVLSAARAKGSTVNAIALDEYRTSIPFSDCVQYDMILAHQIDGETLTPKTKGPLFLVYPYDSRPELQSVRFYERSIWQLKSLRVE